MHEGKQDPAVMGPTFDPGEPKTFPCPVDEYSHDRRVQVVAEWAHCTWREALAMETDNPVLFHRLATWSAAEREAEPHRWKLQAQEAADAADMK